jgi:hypothetical protein
MLEPKNNTALLPGRVRSTLVAGTVAYDAGAR